VLSLIRTALALALPAGAAPDPALPPTPARAAAVQEEDEESRPFRIPDHAAAKARMDRAQEHAAAGRWREALHELQEVLEEHRGDLLVGERPRSRGGQPSLQPVHPGAGPRAREVLRGLPPEARALYRERHGPEARAAFERAREGADRSALAEVARRWPLTDAARSAWWALGDLEMERGEEDKARSAWSRALASLFDGHGAGSAEATDRGGAAGELEHARASDWAAIEKTLGALEDSPERAGALVRVARARADLEALEAGSAPPDAPSTEAAFADALHPVSLAAGAGAPRARARASPGATSRAGTSPSRSRRTIPTSGPRRSTRRAPATCCSSRPRCACSRCTRGRGRSCGTAASRPAGTR
jgi:tetratricopeptide (TPR) repeat protein